MVWTPLPFSHSANVCLRDCRCFQAALLLLAQSFVYLVEGNTRTSSMYNVSVRTCKHRRKKQVVQLGDVMWCVVSVNPVFAPVAFHVSQCIFPLNKSCGTQWKTELSMTWSDVTALLMPPSPCWPQQYSLGDRKTRLLLFEWMMLFTNILLSVTTKLILS